MNPALLGVAACLAIRPFPQDLTGFIKRFSPENKLLARLRSSDGAANVLYWGVLAKMLKGTDLTEIPIEWMSAT